MTPDDRAADTAALRRIAHLPDPGGPAIDIVAALDRMARETPGALAVAEPDGRRTDAATLAAASRALAGRLAAGAPLPAIFLGTVGWHYMTALVACRRAGRPFVPIDPDGSPLRLTQMLLTSGADVLMHAGPAAGDGALPTGMRAIDLDAIEKDTVERDTIEKGGGAAAAPAADGIAFIVFTSGSTGVAKGAAQTIASHASSLRTEIEAGAIRAGDRVTLVSRAGVVGGPLFSPTAMAAGAGLLLAADGVAPADLLALMARERATHLLCYVGFARALCGHPGAVGAFAGLRALQIYGDVIGGADVATLRGVLPATAEIHAMYGATEFNMVAGAVVPAATDRAIARLPLGRPYPGTEIWLRAAGEPAGAAPEGELYMGGPRVTVGYWRDAAATRARMVPHPDDPARALFATGDLVRLRPDGMLDFVGRVDNQVKLRGWRIELEEIETAARRLPGVRGAGVVPRRSGRGTVDSLALHVAGAVTADAVAAGLAAVLPDHMVPTRVIVGTDLPLTVTGKVDRVRLAEIDLQRREAEDRALAMADATWPDALSARIAAAIAEEIDLASIAPDHRANDVGLDSLDAVSIALRIEKQFAVSIAPDELMGTRTMGEIVAEIAALAIPAPPRPTRPPVPGSP